MGERYWKRPTGLSLGAPDEIEYERADAPTAKQVRQMAWLTREIDRYRNGLWRLNEHDGIEGRIEDLKFLLFRATPHDKRITPLTDVEKSMAVYPLASDIASDGSIVALLPIERIGQPLPGGVTEFRWVPDVSTAPPSPNQ